MSAVVQTLVVVLAIAVAAAYVGRRLWRTLRPRKVDAACGAGCGCEAGAEGSEKDWAKT